VPEIVIDEFYRYFQTARDGMNMKWFVFKSFYTIASNDNFDLKGRFTIFSETLERVGTRNDIKTDVTMLKQVSI
jgi:hypothetical protein